MKRSKLAGPLTACLSLFRNAAARSNAHARSSACGNRHSHPRCVARQERRRHQARRDLPERSARLRRSDTEGRLLAGWIRLRLRLSDVRLSVCRCRRRDRDGLPGRTDGLRGPDAYLRRQHTRPTWPRAAVRGRARHDPRYLQDIRFRHAKRESADGRRPGLATGADRGRTAGRGCDHLFPFRRVARYRCARPTEQCSRQRR